MRVHLIEGDGAYFRFRYKDVSQLAAVMDSERDDISVRGMPELAGTYHSGMDGEAPIWTDFGFMGNGHELLLRVPETAAVRPMLEAVGPILPMPSWLGMRFEASVCETKLDALDPAGMVYCEAGEEWLGTEVLQYAFRPEVVAGATVFRNRGLIGRLFATDRFVDLVRQHGLTGLRILPVWSETEGALATFRRPRNEFLELPPEERQATDRRARIRAVLAARGG